MMAHKKSFATQSIEVKEFRNIDETFL